MSIYKIWRRTVIFLSASVGCRRAVGGLLAQQSKNTSEKQQPPLLVEHVYSNSSRV